MNCPYCQGKTKAVDSRLINRYERIRHRECTECFTRFKTKEEIINATLPAYVLKKIMERENEK